MTPKKQNKNATKKKLQSKNYDIHELKTTLFLDIYTNNYF